MQQSNGHAFKLPQEFLVTATDTNAGKTMLCGALALFAEDQGLSWRYFKPAESGGAPFDSERIVAWTGHPERVSFGYRLETPLAPLFAAEVEGVAIAPETLDQKIKAARGADMLIVEGAGGIHTPYAPGVALIDLAARWRLPVLVVSANRLGCLNHTLLTVEALQNRNIPLLGCVFNDLGDDASALRNVADFTRLSSVPVRAWLRRLQANEAPSAAWWREGVARGAALT